MKETNSNRTIFFQRLILVISLIMTLELLDKTEPNLQFSLTQNLHLEASREQLISLGLYFTSFGILTPLTLLAVKNKTQTPH